MNALGQEFTGKTDNATFRLTLPVRNPERINRRLALLAPVDLPIDTPANFWGTSYISPDGSAQLASVSGVVLQGDVETVDDEPDQDGSYYEPGQLTAWSFGYAFSKWYETASRWLELWTNQLIGYRGTQSSLDGSLSLAGVEHEGVFWDGEVVFRGFGKDHSFPKIDASVDIIRAAFARASETIQAPTEWIALFNARRTSDNRFAVIEAATAAEISLSQAAERHLLLLSADGADWFMRRANGVAVLAQMLRALDRSQDTVKLAEQIAGPRNRAVHRGIRPTEDEALGAIEAAHQILKTYSPFPEWP